MYYIICKSNNERSELISYLQSKQIHAVFHYISLHSSEFFKSYSKEELPELNRSDYYTENLLRLPMYFELSSNDQLYIIENIRNFFLEKYT